MRKFIGLAGVLAFLVVVAVPAQALDLPSGEIKGKINDRSGLFRDDGTNGDAVAGDLNYDHIVTFPAAGGTVLTPPGAAGDELRAVFSVTQLFSPPTALDAFFTSSPSVRLCGVIYNLVILGFTGQTVSFGVGPRYPSAYVDIYLDDDAGVESYVPPTSWVEGDPGGPDTIGQFTNDELWLRAEFVPLATGLIPGTVYQLTLDLGVAPGPTIVLRGTGNGVGYADVVVNNTGRVIGDDYFKAQNGGVANSDMSLQINIDWRNKPYDGWQVSSEDPILFATIPEPASMSLLLVGLVSGAGAYWRRRRAA